MVDATSSSTLGHLRSRLGFDLHSTSSSLSKNSSSNGEIELGLAGIVRTRTPHTVKNGSTHHSSPSSSSSKHHGRKKNVD